MKNQISNSKFPRRTFFRLFLFCRRVRRIWTRGRIFLGAWNQRTRRRGSPLFFMNWSFSICRRKKKILTASCRRCWQGVGWAKLGFWWASITKSCQQAWWFVTSRGWCLFCLPKKKFCAIKNLKSGKNMKLIKWRNIFGKGLDLNLDNLVKRKLASHSASFLIFR